MPEIGGRLRPLAVALRQAAPALLAVVAVRVVGLTVLAIGAARKDVDFWPLLHSRFDALWYTWIAQDGYDEGLSGLRPSGTPRDSNLAFFPLFPALMRAVSAVLPVSLPEAGLIISWAASLAAAWGIFAVGNHVAGSYIAAGNHAAVGNHVAAGNHIAGNHPAARWCGVLLAAAWAALPHGLVLSMAYTETLFTAFAAWTLYALLTQRWLVAAILCVAAGLTRPTAAALIAAVWVGAALAIRANPRDARPYAAAVIAPLGWLGYLAWVGERLGRPDGWFHVQRVWGQRFDGGVATLRTAFPFLAGDAMTAQAFAALALLAVAAIAPIAWAVAQRQPVVLLAYSIGVLVITFGGAGFLHAKPRLLLPAFTLLLPLTLAVSRSRHPRLYGLAVITTMTAVSAAFGLYLALVRRYSP